MTEFTAEWIAGAREVVGNDAASPSGDIAFKALDEIERLQQRIAELEHICTSTIDAFNFHREGDQPTFSDIPKIVKQAISEVNNREHIELLLCKAEQRIAELEQERDAVASDTLWTARGYDKPPQPPKERE